MSLDQKTAIIIPCYNEGQRLDPEVFLAFAQGHPRLSFILVDDGSQDKTPDVIRQMQQRCPNQMVGVSLEKNQGKAEAVRQGFLQAFEGPFDCIGYWDADLATPLNHIEPMREVLNDPRVEVVLGSRVRLLGRHIQRHPVRHYLGRVYATCASLTLQLPVYDTQCGAKLFRQTPQLKKIFSFPFVTTWVFDVEILARMILYNRVNKTGKSPSSFCMEYPLQEWTDKKGSKIKGIDFFVSAVELLKIYKQLHFKNKGSTYLLSLTEPGD